MKTTVKQISSLEKICAWEAPLCDEISRVKLLKGEKFSYQICVRADMKADFKVSVDSPIREHLKLYTVKNNIVDFPTYDWADDDYITKSPCMIPDMLVPLEDENYVLRCAMESVCIWVSVELPRDILCGKYPVSFRFSSDEGDREADESCTFTVEVMDALLPESKLKFTQWFHADCIADAHKVEVYSEAHWSLIEKYVALASELGINMILTPIVSPPLDTKIGTTRPCTQLVRISFDGGKYDFDFTLLGRWIDVCQKHGIKYFEMAHLFSQWGIHYAANVKVTENGEEYYKFGWHTDGHCDEYREFLTAFLPALVKYLDSVGVKDVTYFHISDEPKLDDIEPYQYAHDLITPLIDGCPTMDALSDYEFYEKGLVSTPVTALSHIHNFIEHNTKNQWAYYFCGEAHSVSNRFLAMPSYRNRIIGLQLYKYGIEGFLQWGYNFYYSQESVKKLDPFYSTSADKAFPSGDAFSVYPYLNGAAPSLRALVFREAMGDICICRKLEEIIGRDAVIAMIDDAAGMNVTFKEYPRNSKYVPDLIAEMKQIIEEKL